MKNLRVQHSGLLLPKALLVIGSASLCCVLPSCNLAKKLKSEKKRPAEAQTLQFLVQDSLFIERTASGTDAIVRFQSRNAVFCHLEVTLQDEEEANQTPKAFPCENQEGSKDFAEVIRGLETDELYNVTVTVWLPESTKENGETVVIKEKTATLGAGELMVARLNGPLRSAQVHRYTFEGEISSNDVNKELAQEFGCQKGVPNSISKFSVPDANVGISNLATRGFASSQAKEKPGHTNQLQLSFNTYQAGDRWEWIFQSNGKTRSFISRQAAMFNTVAVVTTQDSPLEDAQLAVAEDTVVDIASGGNLTVEWTAESLSETNSVSVQVGSPGQEQAVYCVFKTKDGKGEVEAKFLSDLPAGKHDLHVTLASHQLQLFPGTSLAPWLIQSYDWRIARIQKL